MQRISSAKIPGGKFVRVKTEIIDGTLSRVEIHGDFFLHPEETISDIEQNLAGISASAKKEEISERIRRSLQKHSANFIGATPEDIADIIVKML